MASSSSATLPMLISLSMAASTSTEEGASEEDRLFQAGPPAGIRVGPAFVVKNTFLEVDEPSFAPQAARRSSSAPPGGTQPDELTLGKSWLHQQLLPLVKLESNCSSDASTSARGEGEDDVASELGSSDGSCCLLAPASPAASLALTLVDILQPPPPQTPQKRLSSNAALYTPKKLSSTAALYTPTVCAAPSDVVSPPQLLPVAAAPQVMPFMQGFAGLLPPEVQSQLEKIAATCQQALHQCDAIHHVRWHSEDANGCTIIASIRTSHGMQAGKRSLAFAGDQMLNAAKQCKSVHMMGAETNPFTSHYGGIGFTVQLAVVEDHDSACYNLIGKGFCSRGYNCRWQHPSWQVPVTVKIEFTQ